MRRVEPVTPMGASAPGMWTRERLAGERDTTDESHERRGGESRSPPYSSALEGSEVHEGFRDAGFGRCCGASPGNASETRPVTAEGHGGEQERPTTCYRTPRLGNWFHHLALAALKGP